MRVMVILLTAALIAAAPLPGQAAPAAASGQIVDDAWGLRFTAPQGWVAQRAPDRPIYLLGSHTMIGLMLVLPTTATRTDALRGEMMQGLHEDGGTALSLNGALEPFGADGLAGDYSGTIEWQPARARAIGRVTDDAGAIVMIATTSDGFTDEHRAAVAALASSMAFSAPDLGPQIAEWDARIRGRVLSQYDRYDSGGGSGGYTSRVTIDLCADGSFFHNDRFSASINVPGATGFTSGDGRGAGRWELAAVGGQLVLRLQPHGEEARNLPLGWGRPLPAGDGRYTRVGDTDYLRTPSRIPGCAGM